MEAIAITAVNIVIVILVLVGVRLLLPPRARRVDNADDNTSGQNNVAVPGSGEPRPEHAVTGVDQPLPHTADHERAGTDPSASGRTTATFIRLGKLDATTAFLVTTTTLERLGFVADPLAGPSVFADRIGRRLQVASVNDGDEPSLAIIADERVGRPVATHLAASLASASHPQRVDRGNEPGSQHRVATQSQQHAPPPLYPADDIARPPQLLPSPSPTEPQLDAGHDRPTRPGPSAGHGGFNGQSVHQVPPIDGRQLPQLQTPASLAFPRPAG